MTTFDRQRLRELTSAVMDGRATTDEQRELTQLLETRATARDEYLALVDLHAVLCSEPVQQAVANIGDQQSELKIPAGARPASRRTRQSPRRLALALVAAAAGLLLVLRITLWPAVPAGPDAAATRVAENKDPAPATQSDSAEQIGFVTVAQTVDVRWSGVVVSTGQRLPPQTLAFDSGVVRLLFDDGVEVTLEGPAEYELIAAGQTRLLSGVLAATVPPGAEGFSVETPTAEVVDLGTSFGIDLRDTAFSSVSVFDGEVEVAALGSEQKRLLREGDSVQIGADQVISDADMVMEHFERLWPVASGITGSSDVFRVLPPWPKKLHFVDSDRAVFVAGEGRRMTLVQDLDVNISAPGDYRRVEDLTPHTLRPGRRIRSYLLHYRPKTQLRMRRARRIEGAITFDRPIAGVIVQHEELLASSRRFSRRPAGEAQQRRQIDLTGDSVGDRITLSQDRRTLTVSFVSPGRSSDLVRVIVEAEGRGP